MLIQQIPLSMPPIRLGSMGQIAVSITNNGVEKVVTFPPKTSPVESSRILV